MADSKKIEFFKITNSQYFLWKFHGLVLELIELNDGKGIDEASGIPEAEIFGQKQRFSAFGLQFRLPNLRVNMAESQISEVFLNVDETKLNTAWLFNLYKNFGVLPMARCFSGQIFGFGLK